MALNWFVQSSTVALSCSTKASAQVFAIALSVLLVSCPCGQCVTVFTALHSCTLSFLGRPRCYWKCAYITYTLLQKLNEHTVNDALLPFSAVFLLWKLFAPCILCCAYSVIVVLSLSRKCIVALAFLFWPKWNCTSCIHSVSVSKACLLQGTLQLNTCCVLCTNGHRWQAHHINAGVGILLGFYYATCNGQSVTSINGYSREKLHYVAKQLHSVFMVLPLLHCFLVCVFLTCQDCGTWPLGLNDFLFLLVICTYFLSL